MQFQEMICKVFFIEILIDDKACNSYKLVQVFFNNNMDFPNYSSR